MRCERNLFSLAGSKGETDKETEQVVQENPEKEADSQDEAGQTPRKPFDDPLPNIEPLPGEPPKWWNP